MSEFVALTNEGQTETIAELKRVRAEAAERFNLPLLKPLDQILPELSPSPTGLVKDSSKLIINGGGGVYCTFSDPRCFLQTHNNRTLDQNT